MIILNKNFVVDVNHNYYGNIKVLKNESSISGHLLKGVSIWERNILQNYLQKYLKNNSLFIDIGAHIGLHSLGVMKYCQDMGYNVKIVSFEPQGGLYELLKYNLTNNNKSNFELNILNYGISNENKVIYDNILDYENKKNCGGHGIKNCKENKTNDNQERIELIKLDDLKYNNVSVIKIDVEGMENQVIEGAMNTIKNNKPIILLEIYGGLDYKKANEEQLKKIHYTISLLTNIGYKWEHIKSHDYFFYFDK
jgi:FkbM family methyltransferase